MRLPLMKRKGEEKRRVLCGEKNLLEIGEHARDARIVAEGLDLAHLPLLAPQKPRTRLSGIAGEVLEFFSNGDSVCLITRVGGSYRACICDGSEHAFWTLDIPEPRENGFLFAHAWRERRLYLPACSLIIDLAARRILRTDQPLVSGDALMEYNESLAIRKRHKIFFLSGNLSQYHIGEYVVVKYCRFEETVERALLLQIVAADNENGSFTVEGEGAPDLLNAEPGTVSMAYDMPNLDGIFADHERLYGFSRNRIYISAKGDALCFTPVAAHEPQEAARIIEIDAELTGGCMYRGKPLFFTDGAVIRVTEDSELGFRVSVLPTVGVTPRAAVSPAVVGDKICYFSRHGLALFDGKRGSVVRSGILQPKGGAAVADGRFYSFFALDGRRQSLYAYDAERDLLYEQGGTDQFGAMHALGGVLISTEYADGESQLIIFCERNALPHPISQMVSNGVLSEAEDEKKEARLVLGEVREGVKTCSPTALEIDARLEKDAVLTVSLFLDGESDPCASFAIDGTGERAVQRLLCLPRRCGAWHVVLGAKGDFCVFTVTAIGYT